MKLRPGALMGCVIVVMAPCAEVVTGDRDPLRVLKRGLETLVARRVTLLGLFFLAVVRILLLDPSADDVVE